MRRQAHGLTLVEMLVILAVVILLGLIFWPHCTSRQSARRVICLSNLKQIGLATSMYIQDYDGTLPWNPAPGRLPASHWAPLFRASDCAAEPTTSFIKLLQPYTKSDQWLVFHCPSYPGYPASRHLGYASSLTPTVANQIGYGFNERLIGSPCRPRTLASLKTDPATLVLFGEADQPWAGSPGAWVQESGAWTHNWGWTRPGPSATRMARASSMPTATRASCVRWCGAALRTASTRARATIRRRGWNDDNRKPAGVHDDGWWRAEHSVRLGLGRSPALHVIPHAARAEGPRHPPRGVCRLARLLGPLRVHRGLRPPCRRPAPP